MEKLNAIVIDGKVYETVKSESETCIFCDFANDDGECPCRDFCFQQGRKLLPIPNRQTE